MSLNIVEEVHPVGWDNEGRLYHLTSQWSLFEEVMLEELLSEVLFNKVYNIILYMIIIIIIIARSYRLNPLTY